VGLDLPDGADLAKPSGISDGQLPPEMRPFILELPISASDPARPLRAADLATVEAVTTPIRLFDDATKISRKASDRRLLLAEPQQLRVTYIPLRPAPQHGLRKEAFSPERDEAARI
jgi:hypothetical protein